MFREGRGGIPPHLLAAAMAGNGGGVPDQPGRGFLRLGPLGRHLQGGSPEPRVVRSPAAMPPEAGPSAAEHPNTERLRRVFPDITQEGVRTVTAMNEVLASEPGMGGLQIGEPLAQPSEPLPNGKQRVPATVKWIGTSEEVAGGYPIGLLGERWKYFRPPEDASKYTPSRERQYWWEKSPPAFVQATVEEPSGSVTQQSEADEARTARAEEVRRLKKKLANDVTFNRKTNGDSWEGDPLALPDNRSSADTRAELRSAMDEQAQDTVVVTPRDLPVTKGMVVYKITNAGWPVPKEKWPQEDQEAYDNHRENRDV